VKVVVTGASGFIGSHLLDVLIRKGFRVVAASRSPVEGDGIEWRRAPELGPGADWSSVLSGAEGVVHLAGRAHIGTKTKLEENLHRRINELGTLRLVNQAAAEGVRHFVFVSSIGAVTESSDSMVTEATPCRPTNPYGQSKLAAEEEVKSASANMAWTILRPPLVYGPGNPGNMRRLFQLMQTGLPLPLASVRNRRSFIFVRNLADVITLCPGNPHAFGKVFLPSDGDDLSTPDLLRAIVRVQALRKGQSGRSKPRIGDERATGAGRAAGDARLFPFPERVLKAMGQLPGFDALRKLTSSLYVDSKPISRDLGWSPRFTMLEGLVETLS